MRKMWIADVESPLGPMIAGATDSGVSFLEWHDRGGIERIKERVVKRYECKLITGANRHLSQLQKELSAYFNSSRREFTVPIDIAGTPFERLVWEQLQRIPYGETRSYGQIAKALNKPGSSRAVGRANGSNYLAIVIPCHRVIEANGNLCGYGGKIWRKKALLELERGVRELAL
jgi:AraC family transcriptional regulator, regulatory protein of adaptative response / methylated-DNA-[protein]-cysteine methyltransferase